MDNDDQEAMTGESGMTTDGGEDKKVHLDGDLGDSGPTGLPHEEDEEEDGEESPMNPHPMPSGGDEEGQPDEDGGDDDGMNPM